MSTTCDPIILPPYYSAEAVGGPEFATAVIRSGEGGSIAHRNVNREDPVSKYEIEYANLSKDKKNTLRSFAILRQGQARAFLFLAPDDSELISHNVGFLNQTTGDFNYLDATDGMLTNFYAIRSYSDPFTSYNRRLCFLSSFHDFTVEFLQQSNSQSLGFVEFEAEAYYEQHYEAIAVSKSQNITISGAVRTVTILYREGRIAISPALPAGIVIRLSGVYLLPVCFDDDWMRFSIDESTVGGFKVNVTEILPVELGIT